MFNQWTRELKLEFLWMKRNLVRRWQLDTPTGIMGMLVVISALSLFVVIGSGIARIFRSLVPWVSGSRVEEIYWYSISFGIKTSLLFVIFSASLIIFFLHKISGRN